MVEAGDDCGERVAEQDEVDHHPVGIRGAVDLHRHGPVVAMKGLAEGVGEGDEMPGAEDMHRLAESDREAFHAAFTRASWESRSWPETGPPLRSVVSPSGEPSVTEKNVQRGGAEIGRRAWIDALRMSQRSIEGRSRVAPRRFRLPDDRRGPARDLGGNIGAVAAGDERVGLAGELAEESAHDGLVEGKARCDLHEEIVHQAILERSPAFGPQPGDPVVRGCRGHRRQEIVRRRARQIPATALPHSPWGRNRDRLPGVGCILTREPREPRGDVVGAERPASFHAGDACQGRDRKDDAEIGI